jgi:hypothetical protein
MGRAQTWRGAPIPQQLAKRAVASNNLVRYATLSYELFIPSTVLRIDLLDEGFDTVLGACHQGASVTALRPTYGAGGPGNPAGQLDHAVHVETCR